MCVKGYNGVEGNEEADKMARKTGWIGAWLQRSEVATSAGIKQASPIHTKPAHMKAAGGAYIYSHIPQSVETMAVGYGRAEGDKCDSMRVWDNPEYGTPEELCTHTEREWGAGGGWCWG